jgi:predicted phosphodiesterase
MGDLATDLAAPGPQPDQYQRQRKPYPDGWQPRVEHDETGGYLVTAPSQTAPEHDAALSAYGLDPTQWVVTSRRISRWQRWDGEWLEAARLSFAPRTGGQHARADAEQVIETISKWKPRKPVKAARVPATGSYFSPVGDTQVGKVDGDGTPGTVGRFLTELGESVDRYRCERAETVVLPWLGDCIEGIWSQGGSLRMRLDLAPTEIVRVYRRLMWAQVKAFAASHDGVIELPVIPGNHDESVRTGDKMSTFYDDSWAVDGASAVADGCRENPDLAERVRFVFPQRDQLGVVREYDGLVVGMTHGHQFGRDPFKWWDAQAGGRTPLGDADVLLAAHLHHLHVKDHGGSRLFLQIPALDGGSQWFKHRHGQDSPSRLVTFRIEDGHVRNLDPVM